MKEIMGRWKDEAWIVEEFPSPLFPLKNEEGKTMENEKRIAKRIEKSLLANITINGFDGLGLVYNFSKGGLFISTTKAFPPHSKLMIVLASRDDFYELSGEVVWSANLDDTPGGRASSGMGIRFDDPNDDYVSFVMSQM